MLWEVMVDARDSTRQSDLRRDANLGGVDRSIVALEDKIDRSFDRLEDKISRQFVWLVALQLTILVASVSALLARS